MRRSQSTTEAGAGAIRRACRAWFAVGLGCLFCLSPACGQAVDDSGSNSNWLISCGSDADCAGAMSCECGQCTIRCETQSACTFPGATCAAPDSATCGPVTSAVCVAECARDAECTNIREDLRCVTGLCRVPVQGDLGTGGSGAGGSAAGGTGGSGTGGSAPTQQLPPGDWVTRGSPAECMVGAVDIAASGLSPWGDVSLDETWVSYTTGSTRPEFMTIVFRGTWEDGPLVLGVSISEDPMSGGQLVSREGMQVFATRYLENTASIGSGPYYSEQIEAMGTLSVEEYVPPVDLLEDGAPLTLRGQLELAEDGWLLTAPFDIEIVCWYSPVVIK